MPKFQQRMEIEGNVGRIGELRSHDDRSVIDFSVRAPVLRETEGGGVEDAHGFWVNVSVWGRDAEEVNRLLAVGARVYVMGSTRMDEYTSTKKETRGQLRESLHITAHDVALSLRGLESVEFKKRVSEQPEAAKATKATKAAKAS